MNWTGFFHAIRNYLVPDWTLDAHNFVFLRLFTRESNVTISSIEEVRPTHTIILKKNTCIQKRNMWLEKINTLFFFYPCNEREHTQPQRGPLFPCFLSCHRSSNSFPCWDNLPPSSHSNPTIFFFFLQRNSFQNGKKIQSKHVALVFVPLIVIWKYDTHLPGMKCRVSLAFGSAVADVFILRELLLLLVFFFRRSSSKTGQLTKASKSSIIDQLRDFVERRRKEPTKDRLFPFSLLTLFTHPHRMIQKK